MTNPVKILLGNLKTILSFGSSNANKNVVTDENGDLKVEAKNNHTHANYTNPTIADNLTTNDNAQVLSAKQGVELKSLIDSSKVIEIDKNILCWRDFENFIYENSDTVDLISLLNFSDFLNSTDYNGSFTESDIKENTIYLMWYRSNNFSNYQILVAFKKINNEWFCKYLGTNQYFDINDYALFNHTHSLYLSRRSNDLGFVKTNDTYVGFGTTQGTVAEGNHTHSYNDLSNIPSIIEEFSFYWVDDYLDYLSEHSISFSYDPNTDIVNLVNYLNNESIDFETNKLYKIAYGSSYNHDIYVAFIDNGNGGYTPLYVATTERYVTQYELSTHTHNNYLTSSDISGKADITQSISNNDTTHSPSGSIIYNVLLSSNSTAKNGHTHNISDVTNLQSNLNQKVDSNDLGELAFENWNSFSEVAISGDYNDLDGIPTIPSASNTTPSADTTNGSIGDSSNYAKADHTHPKSTLYADASHSHSFNDLTNKPSTTPITISYIDGTSTTLNVYHS